MRMGNSHKYGSSKGSEATLGIYDSFGQRRREGGKVLDFRNENGRFTRSCFLRFLMV